MLSEINVVILRINKGKITILNYKIEPVETSKVNEESVAYGIPKADMADLLGVSEKTFYNLMQKKHLDRERSDRFLFIDHILESGLEAFGSKENLALWMKTPQPMLDNHKPLDMLTTITGANKVLQILGRIKHGITA